MKKLLILPLAILLAAGCSKTTSYSTPQVSTPVTENASQTGGSTTSQTGTSTSASSSTAGVSGYTMAQVAAANSAAKCWTAIRGDVYDLTSWVDQHPGGGDKILSICGTDGTAAFEGQHGGQRRPERELAGFKIGTLAQ